MEIKFNNVTKIIHRNTIINDVSFSMKSGKIYGLQGINGSGKTMIMRLLAGLIRPTNGKVILDDKVIGKDITFPPSIGLFLEKPAFLDGYTSFKNLKLLASIQNKVSDDKIGETLLKVGLDPYSKKKYRKFSLGMKQRLGIAAAIMEEPELVIMDEPTNSLDESGVNLVKDIIVEQKNRGAIVVVSCHDMSILQELSDEIIVIENGCITNRLAAD